MARPQRKGAQRISEIPPDILDALNAGKIESVNLVEWLAIDQRILLETALPRLGLRAAVRPALDAIASLAKASQMQVMPTVAAVLLATLRSMPKRQAAFDKLAAHPSDIVRSWAAYMIGLDDELTLSLKLNGIRLFAADANSGLRETAWMAVRSDIDRELGAAIKLLIRWTGDHDENIRRFASEATRPRGVWCRHIEALKVHPEMALPLLDPLHGDPARYVQNSVANWLNDASKSRPDWVKELCSEWSKRSKSKETAYIVNRALRTLSKGNLP
jgi:3-methyladenine DNA glycosylase AlkC